MELTWNAPWNASGVGFYIRVDCEFCTRDNLTATAVDFECLCIEIHCKSERNTVCFIIYEHPNSNLDNFTTFLTKAMDKISEEIKYCILMCDFNISLLNYESDIPTDEFINNMAVFCFQSHIVQPTRIADYTATLIDNIFFNYMDYYCIGRNLLLNISYHLPIFLIINKLLVLLLHQLFITMITQILMRKVFCMISN